VSGRQIFAQGQYLGGTIVVEMDLGHGVAGVEVIDLVGIEPVESGKGVGCQQVEYGRPRRSARGQGLARAPGLPVPASFRFQGCQAQDLDEAVSSGSVVGVEGHAVDILHQ